MPIIQIICIIYKKGILLLLVGNVPDTYHIKLNEIERGKRVIFIGNMIIADRKNGKTAMKFFGVVTSLFQFTSLPPLSPFVTNLAYLPPSLPR